MGIPGLGSALRGHWECVFGRDGLWMFVYEPQTGFP